MRRTLIIAAFLAAAAPALAQDAVDPASIGSNVARDLWCASAFGVASSNAEQAGDSVGAISLRDAMTVLFQRVLLQMQAKGLSREQYDDLAARALAFVLDPFRSAQTVFSRESCNAAMVEAQAAIAQMRAPAPVVPAPDTQ